ncbi:SLC13 family permease [Hoeflea sp.]|uniref:SLC13 family permease n=1 Tax=Hoeflea sp. TaxID=1940281 RepID=UPI003B01FF3F
MTLSLAVAIAIFFSISIRQWLPAAVRIWHIMLVGALVLLATRQIAPSEAVRAIDWNVVVYLFGVFSIASALYDSGFPHTVSERIAGSEPSLARALLFFVLLVSLISVVLTNDAGAVIGTPIALSLAIAYRIGPAVPLAALCVVVTVASTMSPVGNPQNILIVADGHFSNPIGTFALWLTVPTLFSLVFAYLWLLWCLKREPQSETGMGDLPVPTRRLAWPAHLGAGLLTVLVIGDSLLQERFPVLDIPLGVLSLIACLPVYIFSPHRISLLRAVDWPTLIFFLAMFVVTGAVLQSGALQTLLGSWRMRLDDPLVVTAIGFWAS